MSPKVRFRRGLLKCLYFINCHSAISKNPADWHFGKMYSFWAYILRKLKKTDLRDILKQLCSYKGVEIIEGHLMPDHVHMLVSIPPKISVSSFMGYLKGKSALMMFDRHANLKYKFGNRHFWSEGYYVSTVGLNEATIKKYIQEQEKADIIQDKLGVKEYEAPFKGQG